MKAWVEGELTINGNIRLVFNGQPLTAQIFAGEGDDWHKVKYVRGFILRGEAPYREFELTLDVVALNAEGELMGSQP